MRNGEQGSICDCCGKEIEPFNTHRVVIRNLLKGKKYDKVSSDTVTKDIFTRHFCDDCVLKVERVINYMCNESKEKLNKK